MKHFLSESQKQAAVVFLSGWLDKVSVGCLIVGLFQEKHIIGGFIGAGVCFLVGIALKVRSVKNVL